MDKRTLIGILIIASVLVHDDSFVGGFLKRSYRLAI